MVGWEDVYKVIVAMAPLYVALILGYGSIKWWKIFTPDKCEAINQLAYYFTLPLFTFQFTAQIDPFHFNFLYISADALSKLFILIILAVWVNFSAKGSYCWSITSFCLCTMTNSLVVGQPLFKAMYGPIGSDLAVQSSTVQTLVWFTLLLVVLEFRRVGDLESEGVSVVVESRRHKCLRLIRVVGVKLILNPNIYACVLGLVWACFANRWNFEMPSIMEECILVMSKAGTGTAMFSLGLFMALQEKVIACGTSLTIFGMLLKFIAGPAAMAIASVAVGIHGDVLRVSILQAALPQSITSFIFAKEYGLHADVLSTAVIFGTLVSLPVLIGYYAILGFLN